MVRRTTVERSLNRRRTIVAPQTPRTIARIPGNNPSLGALRYGAHQRCDHADDTSHAPMLAEYWPLSDRSKPVTLDRTKWHELKMTVQGSNIKAWINGEPAIDYILGSVPSGGRGTPNPDLLPANNPVLRPPVAGRIGLWSKTDSTSYFKDYVVTLQ